jgi:BirA family biotin operon repressor/biotin-[acetyl-CoA-carboxylase] ligase
VAAAGIAVPPRFLVSTESTNDVARQMAEADAAEWTVVAAAQQTRGRGRLGRSWASVPGKSLLFSLILRPTLEASLAPSLSLLAAWALVEACSSLRAGPVRAKWPNDLMAGGRKLGGILPEARVEGGRLRYLVLGVGVNVTMASEDFPGHLSERATSLAIEGSAGDPRTILQTFLRVFRGAYARVGADPHSIADRYRQVCATIGKHVRARTVEGEDIEGVATDVTPRGELVVEVAGGRRLIAFGELAHLD